MQVTINIPENIPRGEAFNRIKKLEALFLKTSKDIKETPTHEEKEDSWDKLNMEEVAIDTGIEDFAENHDHYLYGTSKHS